MLMATALYFVAPWAFAAAILARGAFCGDII